MCLLKKKRDKRTQYIYKFKCHAAHANTTSIFSGAP